MIPDQAIPDEAIQEPSDPGTKRSRDQAILGDKRSLKTRLPQMAREKEIRVGDGAVVESCRQRIAALGCGRRVPAR